MTKELVDEKATEQDIVRHCEEGKHSAARRSNLWNECEKLFWEHAPALLSLSFRNNISHTNHYGTSQSLINVKHLFAYSPIGLFALRKRAAFTLAEILVTLAVIGIVAAMTIPNLVQSYKKKVVETRLVQFYSMMNQAIKLSEIDNGEQSSWLSLTNGTLNEYSIEEYFNKYLAPYLKYEKTEVVKSDISMYVYFANGTLMSISNLSGRQNPHFFLHINGRKSAFAARGTDEFIFIQVFFDDSPYAHTSLYRQGGIVPYTYRYRGWDNVADDQIDKILREDKDYGCYAGNQKNYCTALIMRNGWKIPKDYPFKF